MVEERNEKNMDTFDNNLTHRYKEFAQGHAQLRRQLLESLPADQWAEEPVKAAAGKESSFVGVKLRFAMRAALAAAAVFAIFLGTTSLLSPGTEDPQAAWATAIGKTTQLQSIHFTMTTPNGGKGVFAEMWWQQPDSFRMEIGGFVQTSNGRKRCNYNNKTNVLAISDAEGPGPEMMILSELGGLFLSEKHRGLFSSEKYLLSGDIINKSEVLNCEEVIYKGESCLKIVSTMNGDRFEYVLDKKEQLIYEVKRFGGTSGKLKSHVVVLEADKEIPESMFEIEAKGGKVIDRRLKR